MIPTTPAARSLRRRAAPAHARIASDTAILHPPQDLDGLGGTRRAASTPGTRPPHTYQEGGVHGSAEAPWGEAHTQAHPLGGSTRSSVVRVCCSVEKDIHTYIYIMIKGYV